MLGLEIEDDHIKFCQADFYAGKFEIHKLGIFSLPLSPETTQFLRKTFRNWGSAVRASIPRRKVSVHYPVFPSHKKEEIHHMAHYQALRQFPYRDINVNYSVSILSRLSQGTRVILAVVGEEIINRYLSEVKGFILPTAVTMNSLGILNFYKKIRGNQERIILALDAEYTNFVITSGGKMLFCREINKGYRIIEEKGVESWQAEILHSVNSFNKEGISSPISGVSIIGPGNIKFLKEEISSLPFDDLEFIYQEDFIRRGEGCEILGEKREEYLLAAVLGLAVMEEMEIDLTPSAIIQEIYKRRVFKQKKQAVLLWTVVFLEILCLFGLEYRRRKLYLRDINSVLRELNPTIQKLEEKKKVVDFFLSRSKMPFFLDIFDKIVTTIPQGVFIQRLEYERESEIRIEGKSSSPQLIYDFYKSLKEIPDVKSVTDFRVNSTSPAENLFSLRIKLQ